MNPMELFLTRRNLLRCGLRGGLVLGGLALFTPGVPVGYCQGCPQAVPGGSRWPNPEAC